MGSTDEAESHLLTPNDYINEIAKRNKRVLFGASVHPYRGKKEVLAKTRRCLDHGAVLFKWIPSSQQIDPWGDRCIPFYEILARENVPLLCHTGAELAVPTSDFGSHKFNDPRRLKKPLDLGAKVIAAHCATPDLAAILPEDKGYFDELMTMLRDSSLYADISAFCTPTRITYLKRIHKEVRKGAITPDRFLYGSNFPIPIVNINTFKKPLNLQELQEHITGQGNPLDQNYEILKEFGMHESIFTNAWNVLRVSGIQ